jgi:hypothetical protein
MTTTTHPRPRRRYATRALTVVAVVTVATAAYAAMRDHTGHDQGHESEPARAPSPSAPTTGPATTTRDRHPLVALMARYDQLYARITADAAAVDNPRHPLQAEIRALLTPSSPLWPSRVVGAYRTRYPPGYTQHPGATRPDALRPGERNAQRPLVHELTGPLPAVDGTRDATATVRACVHGDYRILDPAGAGREWALDTRTDTRITFHRTAGRWRLHGITWHANQCVRCGPEPPGTAHLTTYIDPRTGTERNRPTPDRPCNDRSRL